eukprot:TRINITY_DN1377_c0_g2_i2.p1 TRINITY_DN1377_c0_g2~~TRINITY_DN1377_c0_g2_i2.p1  ORF type:complete len:298 (+),score=112.37 TRINITY_DN1377_c0_g2_i2:30-896(+)
MEGPPEPEAQVGEQEQEELKNELAEEVGESEKVPPMEEEVLVAQPQEQAETEAAAPQEAEVEAAPEPEAKVEHADPQPEPKEPEAETRAEGDEAVPETVEEPKAASTEDVPEKEDHEPEKTEERTEETRPESTEEVKDQEAEVTEAAPEASTTPKHESAAPEKQAALSETAEEEKGHSESPTTSPKAKAYIHPMDAATKSMNDKEAYAKAVALQNKTLSALITTTSKLNTFNKASESQLPHMKANFEKHSAMMLALGKDLQNIDSMLQNIRHRLVSLGGKPPEERKET